MGGACHKRIAPVSSSGTVAEENSSSVPQEEHNNTTPGRWQIGERLHRCKGTAMAALKGWIKQETVVLVKLAIPIVSFSITQICACGCHCIARLNTSSKCYAIDRLGCMVESVDTSCKTLYTFISSSSFSVCRL